MATLTYDPTPADQPEFTPEEQDSIAVGEQLAQQEEQLLAGKYQNARELEKAYVELQRKLGQQSQDEEPDVPEETSDETEEEEEVQPKEDVEEQPEEEKETTTVGLTEQDVAILMDMVGGKEAYSNMISWASETMTKDEIAMFDQVMDLNNPYAAFFAIKTVQTAYENTVGKEGRMLTGNAPSNKKDVFRSQAEVVQAMSDPKYESDPAYRDDVFQKLDRSNLQF